MKTALDFLTLASKKILVIECEGLSFSLCLSVSVSLSHTQTYMNSGRFLNI